ncbi:MAG: hypothetical protein QMD14_02680 [Candidatus Aenigmarchaeota archaeon]|nr:hypothetical protein [Candidatus Aenigmarchaeota archaeon]
MVVRKIKGKGWFTIVAPGYFGGVELTRTLASKPQELVGRRLTVSVVDLTDDVKKFYMKMIFRINEVKEDKGFTEFDVFEVMRDYLARMVVHRVRRIDIIQDLKTKDEVGLRVKVLATTSKKAKATIEKAVRLKLADLVKNEIEKLTLEEFLKGVISGELRSSIIAESRKTYPLRNFEFRRIERIRKSLPES